MDKGLLSAREIPGIVYSYLETQKLAGEQFIAEHGICYLISGSLKASDAGEKKVFSAGELIFFRKNFLSKFIKQPAENGSFKSIAIVFDSDTLMQFSKKYNVVYEQKYVKEHAVLLLKHNLLLENFYKSLLPYFDSSIPEQLVNLKKQEALMLLLQIDPELKNILFDFNQPGKIDLEAFMQKNFKFNVELKKLAFLTGRSLATFKRDFNKIFHMPPKRWLQQRRLEEARYLIKEKSKRPSDIYAELGFESLSHFSYSFKQFFGTNPSIINK